MTADEIANRRQSSMMGMLPTYSMYRRMDGLKDDDMDMSNKPQDNQ